MSIPQEKSTGGWTTVEQTEVLIPNLTIKELLDVIPPHCYHKSTLLSLAYVFREVGLIVACFKISTSIDARLVPEYLSLPHSSLYTLASFSLWSIYGFWAGLIMTGLWANGHECGHLGFSDHKWVNHLVGWVIHSSLGVPYHSWRITHSHHHAATSHLTREEAFVPDTRSEAGLPPLNPEEENLEGSRVSDKLKQEFCEALSDSPLGNLVTITFVLLIGFQWYLTTNIAGQKRYPKNTNHFDPNSIIFQPHQRSQVIISNIGMLIWLGTIVASTYQWGFLVVLRTYIIPYLWVTQWLTLVTFLQHTDPLVPRYRSAAFTFQRGALATLDRSFLGGCGKAMAWIGATLSHGIAECHVVHHVSSKIPHYHSWEAAKALRSRLDAAGLISQGNPVGWAEAYRVWRECKFVEDEGDVVFFKNAKGLAASRPVYHSDDQDHDSGIESDKDI